MSSTVKPSHTEEEYFARQEVDKKMRLSKERSEVMVAKEREDRKKLHWMHCSKCGMELHTITFKGFILEKCFDCGAVVLDADEFDKLAGSEDGFLSAVVGLFK